MIDDWILEKTISVEPNGFRDILHLKFMHKPSQVVHKLLQDTNFNHGDTKSLVVFELVLGSLCLQGLEEVILLNVRVEGQLTHTKGVITHHIDFIPHFGSKHLSKCLNLLLNSFNLVSVTIDSIE